MADEWKFRWMDKHNERRERRGIERRRDKGNRERRIERVIVPFLLSVRLSVRLSACPPGKRTPLHMSPYLADTLLPRVTM